MKYFCANQSNDFDHVSASFGNCSAALPRISSPPLTQLFATGCESCFAAAALSVPNLQRIVYMDTATCCGHSVPLVLIA